jgi:hypothetical protein
MWSSRRPHGMMECWNIDLKLPKTTLNYPFQQISTQFSIIPVFHPSKRLEPSHHIRTLGTAGSKPLSPNL